MQKIKNEEVYQEKYRPQFHYTPEANWLNDPNGMVYYNGEYHLFYQYYPNAAVWGPMHWGHAISRDLVHWEHMPIALYPDDLGYIFSGSAVIDENNTSGFGENAMVAIFTYHDPVVEESGGNTFQTQAIAYSLDAGRSFVKYEGNPVLPNPGIADFRDPKVFYHTQTARWIMILAAHDRVMLYSSANLKEWTFESEFGMEVSVEGNVWECPDLFPLTVEETGTQKWVMLVSVNPGGPNVGSATQYFVGEFDGHQFVNEGSALQWLDLGRDDYAGVTWSNIPPEDGRRLFIGWMSNWLYADRVPTETWRGGMTIPRELTLVADGSGYLLVSKPIAELQTLRGEIQKIEDISSVSGEQEIPIGDINLNQSELILDLQIGSSAVDSFGIILENELNERLVISYSVNSGQFLLDRSMAGTNDFAEEFSGSAVAPYSIGDEVRLHLFVDAASVELFVDDGQLVITDLVFPTNNFNQLKLFSTAGDIQLTSIELYGLNSIW